VSQWRSLPEYLLWSHVTCIRMARDEAPSFYCHNKSNLLLSNFNSLCNFMIICGYNTCSHILKACITVNKCSCVIFRLIQIYHQGSIYKSCRSCIDQAKRATSSSCPICRDEEFPTVPNKQIDCEVKSLRVSCTNKNKGCAWRLR